MAIDKKTPVKSRKARKPRKAEATPPTLNAPNASEKKAIINAIANVEARPSRFDMKISLDGDGQITDMSADHSGAAGWAMRLQDAFGSCGIAFPILAVNQLIAASRVGNGENDRARMSAMLAIVDGANPVDERQAMLACQMAVTHNLAMELMRRAQRADLIPQLESAGNMAVKLLRTFTMQSEVLAKLQRGYSQSVRVEHVHVYEGGQAIVGNVARGGTPGTSVPGRGQDKNQNQPHAKAEVPAALSAPGVAPMPEMRRQDAEPDAVPVTRSQGKTPLSDARRRQR